MTRALSARGVLRPSGWAAEARHGALVAPPARGYRSTRNYIAMIHLTAGKLDVAITHSK